LLHFFVGSLGVRVVLLVRDPRGTLQSRKHRDWCPGNPDCFEAVRLCTDLVADYSAAVRLVMKYPHRFRYVPTICALWIYLEWRAWRLFWICVFYKFSIFILCSMLLDARFSQWWRYKLRSSGLWCSTTWHRLELYMLWISGWNTISPAC